jgi:lactate permease
MDIDLVGNVSDKVAPMGLPMAFMPYALLTVIALAASMIGPVADRLNSITFGLPFPDVTTGYATSNADVGSYAPIAPLTNPGTSLIITSIVAWIVFRARGYYKAWQAVHPDDDKVSIASSLLASAVPASVPIIAFLAMARIMDHSGQNEALAYGIAAIAPAYVFAFLANGIGVIGAFTTSSSTSSNVLFSGLQVTLAGLKGLSAATILAAQSAGGAIGNAIGPANVVLGCSTAGISGQEGDVLRKTLPWTLAAFVLTGAATILLLLLGV